MISILFTSSNSILSRLIRDVTGEPVSHCAVRVDGVVVHSNLLGPNITTLDEFRKYSEIVYEIEVQGDQYKLMSLLAATDSSWYDIPGLIYSGLIIWARARFPWLRISKQNLWQVSGMYLCTEFVTEFLYGEADSLVTPYGLYKRLVGE